MFRSISFHDMINFVKEEDRWASHFSPPPSSPTPPDKMHHYALSRAEERGTPGLRLYRRFIARHQQRLR